MKNNIAMINLNLLNEMVKESPKYLIVNSATLRMIEKSKDSSYRWIDSPNFHAYRGVPIAVCEMLQYGEIETVKE